ncbi:glutamine synthetase family protein [Aetokthonos hydrillicola Thurmond2011]|jgi:glutamine synthetase|uniref:glutamine synthetase n=1 Tax=Aetokthonos hydrillicola Thurmond2011 TaxID=2712845 RepID=A0AAP5M7J0_9CYAN|nr:glutamine synthetase family protein [Aetokthonos hydrillicola]MBO3460019.1 glutamine synthetase [Aetokthonos hydrillicola CCALA 1050]MBW4584616.1 glutamine synthetase family protein [Aetokthonos hydrillicola CCALA 1050]MDR9895160.1 glutamine synthetase family protein [Aetokthonos hydrillicola Thurmond2011]
MKRPGFIERHNLWTEIQKEASQKIKAVVKEQDLLLIRTAWSDQHGIVHSKWLLPQEFLSTLENGMHISTGTFLFDTGSAMVFNPFVPGGSLDIPLMTGGPNIVAVPDPDTFTILPWAKRTGFILCDEYFQNGQAMPFSSRGILRQSLAELDQRGLEYIIGLEVEWYLAKLEDPMLEFTHVGSYGKPGEPALISAVEHSFQYLSEPHNPEIHDLLLVLAENLVKMGLPLRSIENEGGIGQYEFTFDAMPALQAADTMMILRMATKQICRQQGYIASFMCLPKLQGCSSNGWHVHQSLVDRTTGENAFMSADSKILISDLGKHFIGGILKHANAASVFATPTINGYKRYRSHSLAPDRVGWGLENRGAMIRLLGGFDNPSTHIENRIGESAANPYLYIASQLISGLDGIDYQLDPGSPTEEPYAAEHPMLPKSLSEAISHLSQSTLFSQKMGQEFINFITKIKQSEINRFLESVTDQLPEEYLTQVTDWEQREYFELF